MGRQTFFQRFLFRTPARKIRQKFTIGQGDYLPDWVSAIKSMKKGGRSRLILTSQNAYKSKGFGPIPGNTPIVFEIELVSVNGK